MSTHEKHIQTAPATDGFCLASVLCDMLAREVANPFTALSLLSRAGLHWLEKENPEIPEAKKCLSELVHIIGETVRSYDGLVGEIRSSIACQERGQAQGNNDAQPLGPAKGSALLMALLDECCTERQCTHVRCKSGSG